MKTRKMKARTWHTRSTVIDSDDSQGESDGSETRENGFFDDEAAESAESTDEDSASEDEIDPFPFTRLPPELRLRVWSMFCPELSGSPRVLDLVINDSLHRTRTGKCMVVVPGRCLEEQTEALRSLSAVNRQCRALVTDKFPDEVYIESDNGEHMTLRVNFESDIMMLERFPGHQSSGIYVDLEMTMFNLNGFSEGIMNLALPLNDFDDRDDDNIVGAWLAKFTSLRRVFLYADDNEYGRRRLKDEAIRWCASPHASQYYMQTFEKEPGLGEDYTKLICWVDNYANPTFAKTYVPQWHKRFLTTGQEETFEDADISIHPMVVFQDELSLSRFQDLLAMEHVPLKLYNEDDEDEDEDSDAESQSMAADSDDDFGDAALDVDDYESEGIDDDEPEVFDEPGDEHLDDGDSNDDHDDTAPNPFSSPEPSGDEGSGMRGRKRRVISDSDDEDGEENEDAGPSNRPAKRPRVHVIQDSDDEDVSLANGAKDPQVISSDSDEEPAPKQRRRARPVESEDEQEDEEDVSEEEAPRARLADRLQIRSRKRHFAVDDEDDEDEDEEDEEEDEDGEDEEEDDDDEGAFIDNMAEESGEDDEDEDEDEDEEEDE